MKFLKILLGAIVLLALLFFGNGILNPSVSYGAEVTVDKPIKEAWAVMTDESRLSEWMKDIKSIKHISGEKNTTGAVTEYAVDNNGADMTMQETITSFRPNEHMGMTFIMDMMDIDYQVFFTKNNGKTIIRSEAITKGKGIFMKSLFSFMGRDGMVVQEETNLNNLKKLIGENTKDYFPEPVVEMIEEN